ncbi:LPS-assembly protein LptD [Oceanicoccus sp. KOV_DT_Chl]|uniref:LPS-assembly protein LptD n=1 Tax=Oceanicoccus sp. KOV_DT_Chl TaxID=1904639 RepID=UPI000C7CC7F7|nr:LPS-assembly protein LptD [Oceanicoccus sp. KOV_DT_Chl]
MTSVFSSLISRPFFSLIIAASAAIAAANPDAPAKQQWTCLPGDDGEWQCQPATNTASAISSDNSQPSSLAGKPRAATIPSATTAESYRQWDWVPKSQLTDPSVCKTGCDGAYIAPPADWDNADKDPKNAPLMANADNSTMGNSSVNLSGDVVLTQGSSFARADQATLNRSTNQFLLTGDILVRESNLLVRADQAQFNTVSKTGAFSGARFLQHKSGLRGEAQLLQKPNPTTLDLSQGTITQCTPGDEIWYFKASNIHLDMDEGWGEAHHARLYLQDIPVLYTPYITFPIDDRRKSGFLWPTLASSDSNGFEITAPYYFNIAPNYDATIAPRYIEKRGMMTELEMRQLSQYGSWTVGGAFLEDDQYTEVAEDIDEDTPSQKKRWLGTIKHSGNLLGLSTSIDYNKVSDMDFFQDLSTESLELKRSTHLNQQATVRFITNQWQTSLTAQEFQTIDETIAKQYKLMPSLSINKNNSGVNFHPETLFTANFTDFEHEQSIDEGGNFVTGQRSYAEAGIRYPMQWAAGFIVPTAKLRSVAYDLDTVQANADDTPTATVPLATLDMGLIFERATEFSSTSYTQTLEPRLYYFYSDYEEQAGNPDFDTKELTFGYSQLFRDTRFSGYDRLDDANQASIGVTSRFIDNAEGREQLTLSLGQIFYFADRRVQLNQITEADELPNSHIAAEVQFQPTDRLWLSNTVLWDSRQDEIEEGGVSIHYQTAGNSLYNLGHRFRRGAGIGRKDNGERADLSQTDASFVLPINNQWSTFAQYRYDVEQHRSVDQLIGLQYEDCCWMARLIYQDNFDDEYTDTITNEPVTEYDRAFIIEFQLKGFGGGNSKGESLLKESILGYEDLE